MENILQVQTQPKVLACVDNSTYAQSVADYAAWAAVQLKAPLELLHVLTDHHPEAQVTDHSGVIGVDSSERLLEDLSSHEGAINKNAREQGRALLAALRTRCLNAGANTDVRLRYGGLHETLQERSTDTRLYVLGRRGESAGHTQRDLGRHVERVVRGLEKPILAITNAFHTPQRVVIAFDGSAIIRKGIESLVQTTLLKNLHVHILMAGQPSKAKQNALDWAGKTLEDQSISLTSTIIAGDAEAVINRYIALHHIDLLIMGAYTHSPLRSMIWGSTTNELLRSATVPVLILR